jgi:hypothetical protein
MTERLNFTLGNAKLKKDTAILSLPAGFTCPFAKTCRSCADRVTGKIKDGPHAQIRCYATGAECLFPNIRKSRWHNFETLKNAKTVIGMANLIEQGIINRKKVKLVRFHQSGDFWSQDYFDAWLMVARQHSNLIFYGYSKALPYWIKRLGEIPSNFKLVASRGGTHDSLIEMFGLRSARVVFSEREARRKWHLPIDHDDTLCWKGITDFCIIIHGTQPKNSKASRAWYKIFKSGHGGYRSDYFGSHKTRHRIKKKTLPAIKNFSYSLPFGGPTGRSPKYSLSHYQSGRVKQTHRQTK